MSKIFYTSDQHFDHSNILKYCSRSFDTIDEMNEEIIKRYNEIVSKNDTVYFLGDVAFYNKNPRRLLERLNGHKHLIIGNHDKKNKSIKNWSGWASIQDYKEIKDNGRKVVLFHYPLWSWNGMYHGTIHLHGHCHGMRPRWIGKKIADVGVDVWDLRPVSLDTIEQEMSSRGEWDMSKLNLTDERPSRRNM